MAFDPRLLIRTIAELSVGLLPVMGADVTGDLIELLLSSRKAAKDRKLDGGLVTSSDDEERERLIEASLGAGDERTRAVYEAYVESLRAMEQATEELDPELQEPAKRVVQANLEYIEAENEAREALERGDSVAHAAALRKLERIDREIQTFELMKGMHEAMKQSAGTLEEIKAARELAGLEQASQATFNKKMTRVALIVAGGSLGVALIMPFVEHIFLKDPETVVVVQQPTGAPSASVSAP